MTEEPTSTLSELFAKDPLHYTKQDLSTVVEYMRQKRHLFTAGDKTAGKVKPKADPKKAAEAQDFLKDLGL